MPGILKSIVSPELILHRLVTNFQGGGGLMREVQIQVDVWTARELKRPILIRIAYEAFGLKLP